MTAPVYRVSMNALRDALAVWLGTVTGIGADKVIVANQGHPFPTTPCATIHVRSRDRASNFDEHRLEAGQFYVSGLRNFAVDINIYGVDANQLLQDACDAIETDQIQSPLWAAGLSIVECEKVVDLTHLLETEREERAQVSITVQTASNVSDPGVTTIDTVNVTTTRPTV
jgi:hypothetical protein